MIGALVLIGGAAVILWLISLGPLVPTRRIRTQREEDMHDVVQRAMNWQPGFPPYDAVWDESGCWKDPETGKVWKRMTLEEALWRDQS